ncbi:MAG: O-methyltransferase [Candidatus Bipolaricaulis sp.]|nr:O-methyltransferase [Candidatus Bipolaricaulis sp.]
MKAQSRTYIESLYATQATRDRYIAETELKEYVPVVDEDVARFLRTLLRMLRPARVLEIGTSIGYSTVSMANGVREYEGRIETIEFNSAVAAQAQENFARAGVSDVVTLLLGDAREVVPRVKPGVDFVFLDVDKRLYSELLPHCTRILRPGGVLVVEDTLFPVINLDAKWHRLIEPIDAFNRLLAAESDLESTILPIGDGVTIAVKRPQGEEVAA